MIDFGKVKSALKQLRKLVFNNTDMIKKIKSDLEDKQDKLTAGKNIEINDNVISATGGGTTGGSNTEIRPDKPTDENTNLWIDTDEYYENEFATVAYSGDYKDLTNKPVIPEEYDDSEIKQEINNLDIEVENITSNMNNINQDLENAKGKIDKNASDITQLNSDLLEQEGNINYLEENKQNKLIAGSNITIDENNVISATGGGTGGGNVDDVKVNGESVVEDKVANIDLTDYASKDYVENEIATFDFIKIVEQLPETGLVNRTYFVPKVDTKTNDLYDEYMWINNSWEFVGTKTIEVDLSDYVKNTDFATQTNAGIIRTSNNFGTNNQGVVYASNRTISQYKSDGNNSFISKGTLENLKTSEITNDSTDVEIPTAKAVYNLIGDIESIIDYINGEV